MQTTLPRENSKMGTEELEEVTRIQPKRETNRA